MSTFTGARQHDRSVEINTRDTQILSFCFIRVESALAY